MIQTACCSHTILVWFFVFFLALTVAAAVDRPLQPQNPVIAHVTMPLVDCDGIVSHPMGDVDRTGGCINHLYVKWLAAAGIRTVPLVWNASWADVQTTLDRVNGVLLPGGDLEGSDWLLYQGAMKPVVAYAVKRNADGDSFFLWGTCQGFQVLLTIFADDVSILKCIYKGVEALMLPLAFTPYGETSSVMFANGPLAAVTGDNAAAQQRTLLGGLTPLELFGTRNVTLNLHQCGVDPQDWNASSKLLQAPLQIIATNMDATGRAFVSAFEAAAAANIFGVQFHPERPQYEFDYSRIGHTDDDVDAAYYLAMFVRKRLQLCTVHRYATPEELNELVVDSYPLQHVGWGKAYYWIPAAGRAAPPARRSSTPATAAQVVRVDMNEAEPLGTFAAARVIPLSLVVAFVIFMFFAVRRSPRLSSIEVCGDVTL